MELEIKDQLYKEIFAKIYDLPVFKSGIEIDCDGTLVWAEIDYVQFFYHGIPDVRLSITNCGIIGGDSDFDTENLVKELIENINDYLN